MSYSDGAGAVVYSTIPLDFYLGGASPFSDIYAPNVVQYGADLFCGGGDDGPPIVEIPTLGVAGLLALVVALALISVFWLRRKRQEQS